ncbi:SpoIIIAH-like family protein [Heyndrickxia sp. NPDC080065]|uniref:SpoIIIAH-like family protein n=1 Tax=Heyndrickxia sp. NPDC080065 TaxID=3390568 RepID=UPI003D0735EF
MLLKKQTVWLLTMLSLVVVLSVYYVTSDPKKSDMAAVDKNNAKNVAQDKNTGKKKTNMNVVTEPSDEVFEQIRLDRQDARSKERDELTNKLASTDLSADERSKALDEMQKLTEAAQTEKVIENLIKSKGYEDVLVRLDNNSMKITVKSKDHDKKAANQILRLVSEEAGNFQKVAVDFEP